MFFDEEDPARRPTPGPLAAWMQQVLIDALVSAGRPPEKARQTATFATVVEIPGAPWQLDVLGALYFAEGPSISREEFARAAAETTEMLRDDDWAPPA